MPRIGRSVALTIALTGLVLSCAKMGNPPGGPEDIQGPQVVKTFPEPDAVRVPRKTEARIRFDEAVNRRAVENSIFLSPDPRDRLQFRWHGNELIVRYLDSLAPEQTYEIILGSQAQDIRGNPIGRPFSLAFSTGDHIDQGRIWGQVVGEERPQSIHLWAYVLGDSAPPNPQIDRPAYRTQPDASGSFYFSHLRAATYRVFAVSDVGLDGLWNPPTDRIGVPPCDVVVTDSSQSYLSFQLSLCDTSSLQIRGVIARDERQLDVRFSRPISATPRFSLENLLGDTVSILAAFENSMDSICWQLAAERPMTKGKWRLTTVLPEMDSLPSKTFVDTVMVHGLSDTTRPNIAKQRPLSRGWLVDPPSSFEFYFSEAIRPNDSIAGFSLRSDWPGDTLFLHSQWSGAAHLSLISSQPLSRGRSYTVAFNAAAFSDFSGNRFGDTISAFTFPVLPSDSLGSLSGILNDLDSSQHVLYARSHPARQLVRTLKNVLPGEFLLEDLPAGSYTLEVLRDRDGSGDFSPGSVIPWRYAESFWIPQDTLSVRPRWDRGGILLNFPTSQ
ncbi:MAG: Ig-like domain-containing protein [bacterium]